MEFTGVHGVVRDSCTVSVPIHTVRSSDLSFLWWGRPPQWKIDAAEALLRTYQPYINWSAIWMCQGEYGKRACAEANIKIMGERRCLDTGQGSE